MRHVLTVFFAVMLTFVTLGWSSAARAADHGAQLELETFEAEILPAHLSAREAPGIGAGSGTTTIVGLGMTVAGLAMFGGGMYQLLADRVQNPFWTIVMVVGGPVVAAAGLVVTVVGAREDRSKPGAWLELQPTGALLEGRF
tara:strand:- start:283 stop:708 length:426 start_codon:yes stop_codon:yes gene_type:complete